MKCPVCSKDADRRNPDFPFCGERCRLIDLGNWAAERYLISTALEPKRQSKEEDGHAEERA
jgi:hypothetical protein